MNLPRIEKHIKKQANSLTAATAFIGLGIAAVGASIDLTAIAAAGLVLPIAMDAWALKVLVGDGRRFKPGPLLYEPFLMKNFKKWFDKYMEESENLVEQKYKVICLNLWMRHKIIDLDRIVMPGENLFRDLGNKLRQIGETKFPIELLFHKYSERMEAVYGEHITAQSFLKEDKDNPEKIAIAKKVYQEYAEIGMAANEFLSGIDSKSCLILQDYKFSSIDYAIIEKYTNNFKRSGLGYFYDVYAEEKNKVINEVIEVEDNIGNLKILENYYKVVMQTQENKDSVDEIAKKLEAKISFLELGGELQEKVDVPTTTVRKTKKI